LLGLAFIQFEKLIEIYPNFSFIAEALIDERKKKQALMRVE
jgi:hypothetical protein